MNNAISFNATDVAVNELMIAAGIKLDVVYCGMNKSDEWNHDLFRVTFSKGAAKFSTDFNTGTGHRISREYGKFNHSDRKEIAKVGGKLCKVSDSDFVRDDYLRGGNRAGIQVFTPAPCAAGILYCYVSDMDLGSESFEEFCSNCGYDTDSRKALEIYLACQSVGNEMTKFFGNTLLNEVRELLEDY